MKLPKAPDALDAEMLADLAFLDAFAARQVSEAQAKPPAPPVAPATRVFSDTWVGEDGKLYYDFEVIGTGKTIRELEVEKNV